MGVLELLGIREESEPDWEYHLVKDAPEPKEVVEVFEEEPSPEYCEFHLDLSPGRYHLQQVDSESKVWGSSVWSLEVEGREQNELEQQIEALRREINRDDQGGRSLDVTDPEELESRLVAHLAEESGPDAALDRLERLEAARSGDGLLQSVDDPTNSQEVLGRVLVDAYDQNSDEISGLLSNLKALTDLKAGMGSSELSSEDYQQIGAAVQEGEIAAAEVSSTEQDVGPSPAPVSSNRERHADVLEGDGEAEAGGDDDGE